MTKSCTYWRLTILHPASFLALIPNPTYKIMPFLRPVIPIGDPQFTVISSLWDQRSLDTKPAWIPIIDKL